MEEYTQNGEFFMEILSSEVSYLSPIGELKLMIGVRDNDGVSFKDSLYVMSLIVGNCDQFPTIEEE